MRASWFDSFFILRPTLFFPSWTFFLAGYARGQGGDPWLYLVWLAAALGLSFLFNQLSDRREDRLNDKLLPRWGDLVSHRTLYGEMAVLFILMAGGCAVAGWELTGLLALFFIIAGVMYNFPPFRLKGRPILGIVSCAVGIWIGYLIGARAGGLDYGNALLFGFPYALAGAAASLLTHIPDLKGDRIAQIRTFPMVYGERWTAFWALLLVVICVPLSFMVGEPALLAAAVISAPFFLLYWRSLNPGMAELAVKLSIFCLAIGVGFSWIPFLVMIAFYYPFARWYHQKRLGMSYPTFRSTGDQPPRREASNAPLTEVEML